MKNYKTLEELNEDYSHLNAEFEAKVAKLKARLKKLENPEPIKGFEEKDCFVDIA